MAFKCPRYTLANLLPVFFVFCIIGSIWSLYAALHLGYLLQWWKPHQLGVDDIFDPEMYRRGVSHTIVSQCLTFMLLLNFGIVFTTDPGSVPENSEWWPSQRGDDALTVNRTSEVKNDGLPRYCKWCECYKPDRCHHCRVCRSCILRMDHHCPWIANCVGYWNHKHFLLLVFYSWTTCLFVSFTMTETLQKALIEETTFTRRFMVVFGMTLASMMALLLTVFLSLHVWLMLRATTTIEFCEKAYKRNGNNPNVASIYDLGYYHNLVAVLGPNPLLWLLPWGLPTGDGLQFKLSRDRQSQVPSRPPSSKDVDSDRERLSSVPEVTGHAASTC
eukprot:TRINITY_DN73126_c0_g1_i1.p1 TRINITY_DN73126_c0_g1~~TRINITY_DN73126_c0_g1_i1.p1  ORF type:complete len:331 (-),score=45.75 TRINITY_DN73126_c0_g1_i1:98-1090(-)